jgi:hypothetical protein
LAGLNGYAGSSGLPAVWRIAVKEACDPSHKEQRRKDDVGGISGGGSKEGLGESGSHKTNPKHNGECSTHVVDRPKTA